MIEAMASGEVTSLEKLLSWKLSELKKSCKEHGLQVSGTKAELAERLHMHHVTAAEQAASRELNEAELLGELEESSAALEEVKEVALVPEAPKPTAAAVKAPKAVKTAKAGTKRKLAAVKPPAVPAETDRVTPKAPTLSPASPEKVVILPEDVKEAPKIGESPKIPLAQLTEEERKLARAKRFGLSPDGAVGGSELTRLQKRAARFGEVSAPALQQNVESEKLQRRLERFGAVSGSKSGLSDEQRKQKRLERFQDASGPAVSTAEEEEKKRRRLERFGGGTTPTVSVGGDAAKLAKRAERFGLVSEAEKRAARAKRFGVTV